MPRVVVAGSINVDLVVRVPRLPSAGETVLGDRLLTIPGGKGANQAVAAARLGAEVRMIGRVGSDAFGPRLRAGLEREGIDVAGVAVDATEPSGAALIVVDDGGQNTITVAPGAGARVGEEELARLRDVGTGDVVVLQCEVPMRFVEEAVSIARQGGATVVLNASPSAALAGRRVPAAQVVIVNEAEAHELGEAALRGLGGAVVMTLGAEGAIVYDHGRETKIDSYRVEVVDATAAGDALVGATAYALARGAGVVEAVRLGVAAGAAACTKVGAQPSLPTGEDLNRLFGVTV